MPLWIQSSLFLIPELHLLMQLSLKRVLTDVSQVSKVHELLTKIHEILKNTVSKRVGNTAHI